MFLTDVAPVPSEASELRAGTSLDQLVSQHFGPVTQLPSLEIALDGRDFAGACDAGFSCVYTTTIAWRTPTVPLPGENHPRVVFERLFGDAGTTDAAIRHAIRAIDGSILDSVVAEVKALTRRLTASDRTKLDEYLDAVRSVEQRIQLAERQSGQALPSVDQPAGIPQNYSDHAKLMFDLQVLAHQGDLTRVSTTVMAREIGGRVYPEIGVHVPHHPISHHGNNPERLEFLSRINAFHMSLFAYYVGRLRDTPDGDGSLLDHMILLYGAGMSDSDKHSAIDVPTLVVGGRGLIDGDRHLRCPAGTMRANLHLGILQSFGVPIEKIGNSVTPITL
jgi:hypothetical protein